MQTPTHISMDIELVLEDSPLCVLIDLTLPVVQHTQWRYDQCGVYVGLPFEHDIRLCMQSMESVYACTSMYVCDSFVSFTLGFLLSRTSGSVCT